jgi:MSHA biogenesis protein MshM
MALVAKPGMGKTTLLFHLLERLRNSARTAFLFQAHTDPREFLGSLMADLGVNDQDNDFGRMQRKLNEVLIRELHAGRRVIVVIDEAQNLEDSLFETVRMLSNFEVPGSKLMEIILAGQPQLADKLASKNLVQLRQRISILTKLTQFSASETAAYIGHRLQVAGYRGKPLFTADALAIIHSLSEGIPRNINNLCFHASTLGFANGQNIIDASILNEVLEDLDVEMLGSGAADNAAAWQIGKQEETDDLGQLTPQMDFVYPKSGHAYWRYNA